MIPITPFDRDTFLHAEIARLVGKWGVEVAFETGTYHGHTTIALSLLCERTFTAEIEEKNYSRACDLFELVYVHGNIIANHGNYPEIIEMNLSDISESRTLYYLDAHWGGTWPLLDELKIVSEQDGPAPIIVIHDFKVPNRPDLGFDSFDGQDLDFNYVKESLGTIYGEEGFDHHYNVLAVGAHRGVIFIEPKK